MYTPDLWYIRRFDLHKVLPEQAMNAIVKDARLQRWGHAAVFDVQRDLDEVYVVLGGKLNLQPDAARRTHTVKVVRGDVFGALRPEDAEGGPEGLVSAYDPVTLAALSREDFERLVSPHMSHVLFRSKMLPLANRRSISLPLQALLYTSPTVRLAKSLIHLAEEAKGAVAERNILIEVPHKASDLARLLGLEAASLEQPLRYFMQRGVLIPEHKRALRIVSLEPLRKAAQGHSLV